MALYVVSGRQNKIKSWLKKICPCFTYSFAEKERIKVGDETKKYAKLLVSKNVNPKEFCPCYCDHLAGCNLVLDLVLHEESVFINDQAALGVGSNYNPKTKTVEINPNRKHKKIITKREGGSVKKRSPKNYTQFAHELIHALDDLNGKLDDTDGHLQEETNSIRGTNQIRKENGVKYHRTHHGDNEIDGPTDPYLDTKDRYNCGCKE